MNIVDILFPKNCLSCNQPGVYICPDCIVKVKYSKQVCIECEKASVDGFTHARCKRPLGLAGVVNLWEYDKVIRQAILKLKYKFAYTIAEELSNYAVKFIKANMNALPNDAILIPTPLHKFRARWRGFNQSAAIGEIIAKRLGWKFDPKLIVRNKNTQPQVELKGKERKRNLRGVFSVNPYYTLNTTNYIVFDDVLTTGTTLKEIGKVLKKGGAGNVWGLTIAR